jgi:hypothetical protein
VRDPHQLLHLIGARHEPVRDPGAKGRLGPFTAASGETTVGAPHAERANPQVKIDKMAGPNGVIEYHVWARARSA